MTFFFFLYFSAVKLLEKNGNLEELAGAKENLARVLMYV